MPPSDVPCPARLWPPLRTASSTPLSRATVTTRATSDASWYEQAQRAFDWFLGWNDLGEQLYCPETGGCRDGLHVDRSNENQGAESMLAFLLSLAEMRSTQNAPNILPRTHRIVPATQ